MDADPPAGRGMTERGMFEELTRLNNDLATLHREVAMQKRDLGLAHEVLQKQAAELSRLNEEKNRFIGIAAHDLRSPIGNITVYAELLLDSPGLDREARSLSAEILELAQDMGALVNEILDVSAIESGTFSLELTEIDLAHATTRALTLSEPAAKRKQVRFVFDPPATPLLLEGDRRKLGQVLDNLLSNAVKFSYPGGAIEIALGATTETVSFSVRDHGEGIPSDEQSRLFTPFEKLSTKSTAGEPNTGLGLTIVRRIVEAHHGSIAVDSRPGDGACFTVQLPRRSSADDVSAASS